MGIALADKASEYGARVELVLGPVSLRPKRTTIKIINVTTAASMAEACISRFPHCDIAIMAAAVADFSPAIVEERKVKRTDNELNIRLIPTQDIAETLGNAKKTSQILAGFALETHDEINNAVRKLHRKNMDLIVLNSLQDKGAGFEHDTNKITLIDNNNNIDNFELKPKEKVAEDILKKIVSLINLKAR